MGCYATPENPDEIMRENHTTQSSEYIIIYEDEIYIVSTISEEILHMLKTNTRSICIFKTNIHMILVEEIFVNVKSNNILRSYKKM